MLNAVSEPKREFVTTQGEEVTTTLTDRQAAETVLENSGRVDDFFVELAGKLDGGLSSAQRPYLHKGALIARGEWEDAGPAAEGLVEIISYFDVAHEHGGLDYPKVRFYSTDPKFRLARQGSGSSYPGAVAVASVRGNDFYGRIRRNGEFYDRAAAPDGIVELLRRFNRDPEGMAQTEGQETGECCFCGLELTEEGSVRVGYGPVCAANYKLPHPQL